MKKKLNNKEVKIITSKHLPKGQAYAMYPLTEEDFKRGTIRLRTVKIDKIEDKNPTCPECFANRRGAVGFHKHTCGKISIE